MKKNMDDSIHFQIFQLYLYGFFVNISLLIIYERKNLLSKKFFDGYNIYTFMIVFSSAFMGLSVSGLMKFRDNMVKRFVSSTAILVTTILSFIVFQNKLTYTFMFLLL